MTTSELVREVFSLVEAKVLSRPSPAEFEMAYQSRIAIERIRFAIKVSEKLHRRSTEGQEACMQLLDALDHLESVDRQFQERFRKSRQHVAIGSPTELERISLLS